MEDEIGPSADVLYINQQIREVKDSDGYIGSVSDGYHTFDELYEHRAMLTIAFFNVLAKSEFPGDYPTPWKSLLHADGSSIEGYFVTGTHTPEGKQVTYYCPIKYWDKLNQLVIELEFAPEWDGHTSADVLKRLEDFK